jgi:hypothetical protein
MNVISSYYFVLPVVDYFSLHEGYSSSCGGAFEGI